MNPDTLKIPIERIENVIYLIRGEKVMLDRDLAELYQVQTKALNQAVRRNRSQFVTGSQKHRDPRFRPYAFTEQGVAMLSSVLHSKRAIAVNVEIMRTFVKLRQLLTSNTELARKLEDLEK